MDTEKIKAVIGKGFSKEKSLKLIIAVGICGIALIYISTLTDGKKAAEQNETAALSQSAGEDYAEQLESSIAEIVTAITGEEAPTVLVTLEGSTKTVYAADELTDTKQSGDETATKTETTHVILKDSSGAQQALTVVSLQPEIKGVVVVSIGAKTPAIKEKLTEAVKTALGISSARVCVTCGN